MMSQITCPQEAQDTVLPPSPPPPPGVAVGEILMHKNDLNSYCQRLNMQFPVYQTSVHGSPHALRFQATVSVGKQSFTSTNTFLTRKSAEQDVANIALQHLLAQDAANAAKLRLYLRQLVCQDKGRCKMILNEFLAKTKMEYISQTVQVDMIPLFVSSFTINGTCYKGEACKSKKEADKEAALGAILSLLDDPTFGTSISEVLKSKFSVSSAAFYETQEEEFVLKSQEAAKSPSQLSLLIDFVTATAASDPANDLIASRKREKNKKKLERKKANKRLRLENK